MDHNNRRTFDDVRSYISNCFHDAECIIRLSEGEGIKTTETRKFATTKHSRNGSTQEDACSSSKCSSTALLAPESEQSESPLHQLPAELVSMIFGYVSKYDDVSKLRLVCKMFNSYCRTRLNDGFLKMGEILDRMKVQIRKELPRRESKRRNHRLSKLSEAYSAMDTRYALLNITFRKYLDCGTACFIPGKVLDEFYSVHKILYRCKLSDGSFTGDTSELLRDLRDMSSMAMEHFEEQILPSLPIPRMNPSPYLGYLLCKDNQRPRFSTPSTSGNLSPVPSPEIRAIEARLKRFEKINSKQAKEISVLKKSVESLQRACQEVTNMHKCLK